MEFTIRATLHLLCVCVCGWIIQLHFWWFYHGKLFISFRAAIKINNKTTVKHSRRVRSERRSVSWTSLRQQQHSNMFGVCCFFGCVCNILRCLAVIMSVAECVLVCFDGDDQERWCCWVPAQREVWVSSLPPSSSSDTLPLSFLPPGALSFFSSLSLSFLSHTLPAFFSLVDAHLCSTKHTQLFKISSLNGQ